MAERMAGGIRDLLLEKQIDSLMAEGLNFSQAFVAATMINPPEGAPAMRRQEALEMVRRLSDG
tara:strand:- start:40 stop:228 length:189 start_codon:yes stop_codon:yes gene_type:complete